MTKMKTCQFDTVLLASGRYRHTCRHCGVVRETAGPCAVAVCAQEGFLPAPAPLSGPSPAESDRRLALCRDCTERPLGCWKARDYGCQRQYRAAERQAAQSGSCPLGHWGAVDRPAGTPRRAIGCAVCGLADPLPEPEQNPAPAAWPHAVATRDAHVAALATHLLEFL